MSEIQMSLESSDSTNPEYISNPFVQTEIFHLIEKIYFINFANQASNVEEIYEYNDTADFELKSIDYENTNVKIHVKNVIKRLRVQHEIVGRKLSDIILQNSQSYSKELKRVSDFKQILEDSFQICRISRRSLELCLDSYIYSQLKLIAKQKKKIKLKKLLKIVRELKNITNATNGIIHLIKTRDFLQALNICTKIEDSISKYDYLKCINGLKNTIKEYYKLIEESSSISLLKNCRKYDENLFANIFMSYQKLNDFKSFFEKISENFLNTINNVSMQTLIHLIISRQYLLDDKEIENKTLKVQVETCIVELKQKKFNDELFSLVILEDYKISLDDLCSNLWKVMKNFYSMAIVMYHNFNCVSQENNINNIAAIQSKIWEEVQIKISTYFRSMDLVNFKFDEYLEILIVLSRFIELGNEFCNKASDCDIIIQAVKEKTLDYIKFYHLSHLEELKMFLENEIWECCPVKGDFSIFNLNEYKFLKSNEAQKPSQSHVEIIGNNINVDSEKSKFKKFEINDNMIFLINVSNEKKDKTNISDEINLLKNNINSEISGINHKIDIDNSISNDDCLVHNLNLLSCIDEEQPILTNTTLNIIRLFEFNQTNETSIDQNERSILNLVDKNNSLSILFKNIKNDIFKNSKISISTINKTKIVHNHEEYILLIKQRIIATESLIYLSKQLENMFPLIKTIIPIKQLKEDEINNLDIYANILRETPNIRKTIYSFIARKAVDYNQIIDSITKVNWDLDEILSQHNSYIDALLRHLNKLKLDLQTLASNIPLNKAIINSILEETLRLCMKILVDGYSLVKKCSNEGRALMQLDFQQFVVKLEEIFDIRPIPDKDYVETYIKAYYLPDSSIEKWVKEHSEYHQKNVISLLGLMSQISKKTRNNVLNYFLNTSAQSISSGYNNSNN